MRRGHFAIAAAVAAALAVPSVAAADCTLPKGVYTANAEYEYQTYLFEGQAETSVGNLASALGTPSDKRRLEEALADVSRGNASRGTVFAGATGTYVAAVATALAAEPPTCTSATAAPAKHKRSAKRR